MTLVDLLEELLEDKDRDIEIEVIDDIDDLLGRLQELVDKEDDEPEDEADEEEDAELEALRNEAKEARREMAEECGEEKAKDVVALCSHYAMIESLLRDSLPLEQKMVDEYNELCRKLYPENCKTLGLALIYASLRKMNELGVKSIE